MSALRNAIVLHLQADGDVIALATGGVYPGLPPESEAEYPFITVTAQQAPRPERVFGATAAEQIAFEDATYLVKAIDRHTSPKTVGEINTAIRASLDGATLEIDGYETLNVIWVQDVQYDEHEKGAIYQHEGGFYQVWAASEE